MDDKVDCYKNPPNITKLFRNQEHVENIIQLVLLNPNVSENREDEIRLVALCNDFGMLSNSLDKDLNGYSDELLVKALVNYFTKNKNN